MFVLDEVLETQIKSVLVHAILRILDFKKLLLLLSAELSQRLHLNLIFESNLTVNSILCCKTRNSLIISHYSEIGSKIIIGAHFLTPFAPVLKTTRRSADVFTFIVAFRQCYGFATDLG